MCSARHTELAARSRSSAPVPPVSPVPVILRALGYGVTIFEKRALGGGLSTYGIIVLREPIETALAEVEMIRRLGVKHRNRSRTRRELMVRAPQRASTPSFSASASGSTPSLGIPGEEHIVDGLAYIEQSKIDPAAMKIGRNVVVIGAGNTAIDCATIAKRLGAERVTMVYRRTDREMTAYRTSTSSSSWKVWSFAS